MKPCALILLAAVAAAAGAPPASATTVQFGVFCTGKYSDECSGPLTQVSGEPDAPSDVVLELEPDGVHVRDALADVRVIDGCRSVGPREAVCPRSHLRARVFTGARDDRVTLVGQPAEVTSGGGSDAIEGSAGDDLLDAGAGADVVSAGAGQDEVRLGDGPSDRADGGPGFDRLNLASRTLPVVVDLAAGTLDGAATLARFESVLGTRGGDRLRGRPGEDVLDGYDGADVLVGGAGPDMLIGGYGSDRLSGGRGNDRLVTDARTCPTGETEEDLLTCNRPDGQGDTVDCGRGRLDRVEHARPVDVLDGCELVELLTSRIRLHRLPGGALRVMVFDCGCPAVTVVVRGFDGRLRGRGRARTGPRFGVVTLRGLSWRGGATVTVRAGRKRGTVDLR
ncbi:MAG TPA: calcium-binding protein [Solirubrobacteraceae bacterium]|jgi:hypothetical protein